MATRGMIAHVHFFVVGVGGLGCPALLGLCAAGARRFTLADPDCVEASNLQRQILFTTADVGRAKVDAAAWALRHRVPALEVKTRAAALLPEHAHRVLAELPPESIVLDCTDSPALKFALNDAALRVGCPLVMGGALGFHGQAMLVQAGSACLRCIYEDVPQRLPSCATAGVLGSSVGVAGFMMAALAAAAANPAQTHLASVREDPTRHETAGALTAIDSSGGRIQTLAPAPRPGCPACASAVPSRFARASFARANSGHATTPLGRREEPSGPPYPEL